MGMVELWGTLLLINLCPNCNDSSLTGPPLETQNEVCNSSNLYKSVGNLREILKIEGCNLGLPQKSRGAIAPLAPLQLQPWYRESSRAAVSVRADSQPADFSGVQLALFKWVQWNQSNQQKRSKPKYQYQKQDSWQNMSA